MKLRKWDSRTKAKIVVEAPIALMPGPSLELAGSDRAWTVQ